MAEKHTSQIYCNGKSHSHTTIFWSLKAQTRKKLHLNKSKEKRQAANILHNGKSIHQFMGNPVELAGDKISNGGLANGVFKGFKGAT